MNQEKNSFDPKTLIKIGKGSLYAGSSAGIVYLLMLSGMEITEASGLATSLMMAVIGITPHQSVEVFFNEQQLF